jgi:tRNA 2-thiocytidine biosynthesis protein TtcA
VLGRLNGEGQEQAPACNDRQLKSRSDAVAKKLVAVVNDDLYCKIRKLTGKAIGDFNLIEAGDRIAVGVSGGKDSWSLLHVLEQQRRRAPVPFELVAVNIDAGYPGYRKEVVEEHLRVHGFAYHMESTNAYRVIEEKRRPRSSYCSFCARLRRGVLYSVAQQLGCNKIALGHHLDDFIETLLLNQFYVGTLAAMSPKLLAENGQQTVIRPFVYVEERDLAAFAKTNEFPVICCACPVCGIVEQKRKRMKKLIRELAAENPQLKRSMIGALGNVHPTHLLDRKLKSF